MWDEKEHTRSEVVSMAAASQVGVVENTRFCEDG